MKYQFTKEMSEISGFGGTYEATCRKMLGIGLEWFDAHPEANPIFGGYKDVLGFITPKNDDAKDLEETIMRQCEDITGVMFHVVIQKILVVHRIGWNKYVEIMEAKNNGKKEP